MGYLKPVLSKTTLGRVQTVPTLMAWVFLTMETSPDICHLAKFFQYLGRENYKSDIYNMSQTGVTI